MSALNRRTVLKAGALGAAAMAAPAVSFAPASASSSNPFTLGVASGDPTPDGFVLWTRLAIDPVAKDGLGGMPERITEVEWQVATDESFSNVVRSGSQATGTDHGHAIHVEPEGLEPGREYFYRFRTGGHESPVGRTRTTPSPASMPTSFTIAMTSCAQWEHGLFTAYRRAAQDAPDLILSLGDYIYEHGPLGYPVSSGRARPMVGGEIYTLADYRRRHALYKTDADLQAAHAAAPWLVTFDDHEVDNNWASEYHELWGKTPSFLKRRAAAFRAYYENMPLRATARPSDGHMQLYRRIRWGRLANLHMMDTRQYRDDQPCGGLVGPCDAARDPKRTITGQAQEDWLLEGFAESQARWDLMGQQVMFAQYDKMPGPGFSTSVDSWDGYLGSKERVMQGWVDADVRNPVVLTGDVHKHYAHDLTGERDGKTETLGAELVTTSVSSGGNGKASEFTPDSENPHMRYKADQRGYVLTRMTPGQLTAEFKTLDYVKQGGAQARTAATFVLEDRQRGLQEG